MSRINIYGELLKCKKCGEEKLFTEEYFKKDKREFSGLSVTCRNCINTSKREKYEKRVYTGKTATYRYNEIVKCAKCKVEYIFNETNFGKDLKRKYGLQSHCKICAKKISRTRSFHRKIYAKTIKGKFSVYKYTAKKRNIYFDLSLGDFEKFWQLPCYYCGDTVFTIGLDRINNTEGYTSTNIVSCCTQCNIMKLDYSYHDFVFKCKQISDLHFKEKF